jgi:DNA-directed RNA polymerase subunit RPC12/RpoP
MTKIELVPVIRRKVKCQKCGYEWFSSSQATKRICCSKCRSSITISEQQQQSQSTLESLLYKTVSSHLIDKDPANKSFFRDFEKQTMKAEKSIAESEWMKKMPGVQTMALSNAKLGNIRTLLEKMSENYKSDPELGNDITEVKKVMDEMIEHFQSYIIFRRSLLQDENLTKTKNKRKSKTTLTKGGRLRKE